MQTIADNFWVELHRFTDQYRGQCLWFLREDFYPQSEREALRVLEYIQRRGDIKAFKRAGKLKTWLLQNSSDSSAGP